LNTPEDFQAAVEEHCGTAAQLGGESSCQPRIAAVERNWFWLRASPSNSALEVDLRRLSRDFPGNWKLAFSSGPPGPCLPAAWRLPLPAVPDADGFRWPCQPGASSTASNWSAWRWSAWGWGLL